MNILILSSEAAQSVIDSQEGQHRLGPVALIDGRYFLSADVLTEPRFAGQLEGLEYEEATLEAVQHLLPVIEGEQL